MILEKLYTTLIICSITISFVFGICFLVLRVPKTDSFRNYRISRYAMAFAYLILGTFNLYEILNDSNLYNFQLSSLITLSIGSFQALLFSFTFITLIDYKYIPKKSFWIDSICTISFIIASFTTYYYNYLNLFKPIFYLNSIFYLYLILKYTILFVSKYRLYTRKMDNYFSEQDSYRFSWVKKAFYSTVVIGSLALVSLYLTLSFVILFNILYVGFYLYFGIRFINYVLVFQEIEQAIEPIEKEILKVEKDSGFAFEKLDFAIEEWEQKKVFTEPFITIEQVAGQVKTNRTYLSTYVNTYKKMTFKEWINHLRIEEAKRLLINHSSMPVSQIGAMVGLPDKSNFGRQFSKKTGNSPQAWRRNQLN